MPGFTCIVYGRTRDILTVEVIHGADVKAVSGEALRMMRDMPDAQSCDVWRDNQKLATYAASSEGGTSQTM